MAGFLLLTQIQTGERERQKDRETDRQDRQTRHNQIEKGDTMTKSLFICAVTMFLFLMLLAEKQKRDARSNVDDNFPFYLGGSAPAHSITLQDPSVFTTGCVSSIGFKSTL